MATVNPYLLGGKASKPNTATKPDEDEVLEDELEDELEDDEGDDDFNDGTELDDFGSDDEDYEDDGPEDEGDAPWENNAPTVNAPAKAEKLGRGGAKDSDTPADEPEEKPKTTGKYFSRDDDRIANSQFYEIEAVSGSKKGKSLKIYCRHPRRELVLKIWERFDQSEGEYRVLEYTPKRLDRKNSFYQSDIFFIELPQHLPPAKGSDTPVPDVYKNDIFDEVYGKVNEARDAAMRAEEAAERAMANESDDDWGIPNDDWRDDDWVTSNQPEHSNQPDFNARIVGKIDQLEDMFRRDLEERQNKPSFIETIKEYAAIAGILVPSLKEIGLFDRSQKTSELEIVKTIIELGKQQQQPQLFEYITPMLPLAFMATVAKIAGNNVDKSQLESMVGPMMQSMNKGNALGNEEPARLPAPKSGAQGSQPQAQQQVADAPSSNLNNSGQGGLTKYTSVADIYNDFVRHAKAGLAYYPASAAIRIMEANNAELVEDFLTTPDEQLIAGFEAAGLRYNDLPSWVKTAKENVIALASQQQQNTQEESDDTEPQAQGEEEEG